MYLLKLFLFFHLCPACLQTAGKDRLSYKPLDHVDQNIKSPSDTKSSISGYESENDVIDSNNHRQSPKKCDQKEVGMVIITYNNNISITNKKQCSLHLVILP